MMDFGSNFLHFTSRLLAILDIGSNFSLLHHKRADFEQSYWRNPT